mgnify:CR=1 FL=1
MISRGTLAELVRKVLEHPEPYSWTLQGFGMLRMYLGEVGRIHVWCPARLATPGVSDVHTHFWALKSTVVSGAVRNVRYSVRPAGPGDGAEPTHVGQLLRTGEGGGLTGEPQPVRLAQRSDESYRAGAAYEQSPDEVHRTLPSSGAVTVMERFEQRLAKKTAWTFWPVGGEWVSAEPRLATADEVAAGCAEALRRWSP